MPGPGPIKPVDLSELGDDDKGDKGKGETRKPSQAERKRQRETEGSLRERIASCFERIADTLENRNETELAEIIREDSGIMADGLASMTRPIKPARTVLLVLVAVVEPALAFGRILRMLAIRMAERRQEARQAAQEEPPPGPYAVPPQHE